MSAYLANVVTTWTNCRLAPSGHQIFAIEVSTVFTWLSSTSKINCNMASIKQLVFKRIIKGGVETHSDSRHRIPPRRIRHWSPRGRSTPPGCSRSRSCRSCPGKCRWGTLKNSLVQALFWNLWLLSENFFASHEKVYIRSSLSEIYGSTRPLHVS